MGQVGVDPTIPVKEENLQSSAFADSLLTHIELLAKFELAIKNALPTKLSGHMLVHPSGFEPLIGYPLGS